MLCRGDILGIQNQKTINFERASLTLQPPFPHNSPEIQVASSFLLTTASSLFCGSLLQNTSNRAESDTERPCWAQKPTPYKEKRKKVPITWN